MIEFNFQKKFTFNYQDLLSDWISRAIVSEKHKEGDLNYIFCSDDYLLELNIKHLKHNTLTDIITFDYSLSKLINGDIFISIDRVRENATIYNISFEEELHRVMIHGILHLCGYTDREKEEKDIMRNKEDYYLSLRTF